MRARFELFRTLSTPLPSPEEGRGTLSSPSTPARPHRLRRRVATIAIAIVAGSLALAAPPASALTRTTPTASISGSGPTALTNPTAVAVDPSSGDFYVTNPPINQRQTITVDATGGELVLSFSGYSTPDHAGTRISYYNIGGGIFTQELEKLPSIGKGNVRVGGPQGGPLTVEFLGALGAAEQPLIAVDTSHLTGGTHSVNVAVTRSAVPEAEVEKFTPAGEFVFSLGSEVDQSTEADLCTAASDHPCQPGLVGSGPGSFVAPNLLAVDPTDGDFYVADNGDNIVSKYDSSGNLLTGWGTGGRLEFAALLQGVTVDSAGDLFILAGNQIHHYTSAGSAVAALFSPEAEDGPANLAPFGLGVDIEDHLYAIRGSPGPSGYPIKFSSSFGEYLGGESIEANPNGEGLALDPHTNDLYLLEADEYDPLTSETNLPDNLLRGGQRVRHIGFNCSEFKTEGCLLEEFGSKTVPLSSFGEPVLSLAHGIAVDGGGTVYVADTANARVAVFKPLPVPELTTSAKADSQTSLTLKGTINPGAGGDVTECQFRYTHDIDEVQTVTINGASGGTYALKMPELGYGERVLTGIALNTSPGELERQIGLLYPTSAHNSISVSGSPGGPYTVQFEDLFANRNVDPIGADTSSLSPAGATVTVETNVQGVPGGSPEVVAPCQPAPPLSAQAEVSTAITGVTPLNVYHFRLFAANAQAGNSSGGETFQIPLPPAVSEESTSEITSDSAAVHAQIVAGGGPATYHVEYLSAAQAHENELHGEEEFANAQGSAAFDAGSNQGAESFTAHLGSLQSATTYRYRVVVENALETVRGAAQSFTTLPFVPTDDTCPNAHVRQQTSAAQLLDCRAYELVSAVEAGGYDVESSLVPGQTPFGGYPHATDRVLYGVHGGGIPGTGSPTNRGVDPYVATRGEGGWSTEYVGIPADGAPSAEAFGSPLLEADAGLGAFAFGGEGLCSPCFADGSTGTPVHLPNGKLVQGMEGPEEPGAGAESEGLIAKHLSADGEHLIFGSTAKFTSDGNEGGDLTIYDRDLKTGETHAVSKTPGGTTMTGTGIAELDVSADGSHVVIGQKVGEDAAHNPYYHLYMDIGDASHSIDLTPGTTEGVLFDGMTEDGSRVFFTSVDAFPVGVALVISDTDQSADLYEAEVGEGGATLQLISTGAGGTGNTDSCDPVGNSTYEHWNTVDPAEESCGIVAIGGGGGVAAGDGTVYFLSPEKLDGASNGTQDAPNLYIARPGQAPKFVTTLESALTAPHPPKLNHVYDHGFGSFTHASALAVDHSSGDLYVLDAGAEEIEKFDAAGNPVDFTAGAGAGTNKMTGAETAAGSFEASAFGGLFTPSELAVEQSTGDFYVPDLAHNVVDKFNSSGELEKGFGVEGEIAVGDPTAVAVDPTDGNLYVSSLFGSVFVFSSSGSSISTFPAGGFLSSLAVDSGGTVYATQAAGFGTGETEIYNSKGKHLGTLDHNAGHSVNVDYSNGEVYVDEGEAIARFDSARNRLETFGTGSLSASGGVTIDPEGNLYATNAGGTEVAVFPPHLAPDPRVDNPAVLDSVADPEMRHTGDFQVTPSGDFAAFPSTLALAAAGEEPAGHTEIFRNDASTETIACASCSPTAAAATGDAALAPDGLSLTDDGRVFFDTTDPLLLADTDNKRDVYEWEPQGTGNCDESSPAFAGAQGACLALLSAGTSPFDSGLLSASANATDAYFFTRDSLVPQDENGPTMKVYDARAGGGFPYYFPPVSCKASDECHGPSSASPGPISVGSATLTQNATGHCKKGFVKRHRKCVRKPHHHKRHRHAKHHRGGKK
jgi:hypothetical protein